MPRVGGLALVIAFLATAAVVALCYPSALKNTGIQSIMALSCVAMFLVGFADDLRPLGAKKKLFLQILIASTVYYLGIRIEQFKDPFTGTIFQLGVWSGPITVLWLVGITNLINLIDGADGLAAGISLMLMVLLAYVGTTAQNMGLIAAGMTGALLGFLYYNFPPAKIFMGDGGAYLLGFLIGLLSIVSSHKGTVAAALISPLFVLALPIVDTFLAILRRGLKGLPLFRPDRKHLHHRLAEIGYSRRKVVLIVYAVTLVFLLMGFGAFWSQGRWVPILLGLAALTFLAGARKLSFSREWFAVGRVLGNSLDMRREVQYALSLNRWFELEGERAESLDELWQDYIYIAHKLGFSSLKMQLGDQIKTWKDTSAEANGHSSLFARYDLKHTKVGMIEIRARAATQGIESPTRLRSNALFSNDNLFLTISELAAEGWHKAALRWEKQNAAPARFAPNPLPASPNDQPRETEIEPAGVIRAEAG